MRSLFSLLSIAISAMLNAQAPAIIPYQAVARDGSGQPMANSNVNVRFTIHDGTTTGTAVWQEVQTLSTSALGLITAQLGSIVQLTNVNWADGSKFMQVEIDLGDGFFDLGTQQMLSVPYALNASISEMAGNGFSHIGPFGDTLYFNNGSFLIVPGIGAANVDANSPFGCTDSQACNYSSEAIVDNNSCQYVGGFCNDGDASTINDSWTMDCTCEGTITAPGATHYCGAQNVHNPDVVYGTMTDQDGNLYKTVIIGNQEWMAENLRVSSFRNGSPLQNYTSNSDWSTANNISDAAWVYYNNDSTYACPYGKLYNKYAATNSSNGLCPVGWHIPTESEWVTLINYLDADANGGISPNDAGGKLKSAGTFFWNGTNTGGSNLTGYSALPGGYRTNAGEFFSEGINGYYWTYSNITNSSSSYTRVFSNSTQSVSIGTSGSASTTSGFSVRCLRD
jgi:uncharacterized protein (TIGR02145 family)